MGKNEQTHERNGSLADGRRTERLASASGDSQQRTDPSAEGGYTEIEKAAFWNKVGPPDGNGCRPWLWTLNTEGRGRHTIRGVTRYAYVYALILSGGRVAKGDTVRHLCGNPSCCEPKHLSTDGGQSANNRDTVRHGRHRSAVLTERDARAIRTRLASDRPPLQYHLAEEFGVSPTSISAVATGKTFPDAGGPIQTSRKH